MKNIAIILAGGSGSRLGFDFPKQFVKVAGKTVIEHTIDVFEKNEKIDEIAIVMKAGFIHDMEQIAAKNSFRKLKKILAGGSERYESSMAAITAYSDLVDDTNLLFHDAVRPLLNDRIINDCVRALDKYNAVDVVIPATDTMVKVDEKAVITQIPDRAFLRNGQTPQAFKLGTIKKAYELALKDPNFTTTDDCGVVLKYLPNEPVFTVLGEQFNIKLTYKEDIFLLDKLFQLRSIKFDSEQALEKDCLKGKNIVIFGGTEGIGLAIDKMASELGARVFSTSRRLGVDVTDAKQVAEFLQKVKQEAGHIDYVINSVGILDKQALSCMDYVDIARSINVNYMGSIICAKEAFGYLQETGGMMLFFTSSSYTRGRQLYSLYSSSKAAIVNLTQALSEEWEATNVRINCINPERTYTPMRTKNFGNEPLNTLLSAQAVAQASVQTLLTKLSGQVIDVKKDGKNSAADIKEN